MGSDRVAAFLEKSSCIEKKAFTNWRVIVPHVNRDACVKALWRGKLLQLLTHLFCLLILLIYRMDHVQQLTRDARPGGLFIFVAKSTGAWHMFWQQGFEQTQESLSSLCDDAIPYSHGWCQRKLSDMAPHGVM